MENLAKSSTPRGVIYNRALAEQIRDFSGLLFGNITPTDIDALIEYRNRGFVFIEAKLGDKEVPFGQKLAITRLCDDLNKPAIFIVAEHLNQVGDIDFSAAVVREYYYKRVWRTPIAANTTVKVAVEKFLDICDRQKG